MDQELDEYRNEHQSLRLVRWATDEMYYDSVIACADKYKDKIARIYIYSDIMFELESIMVTATTEDDGRNISMFCDWLEKNGFTRHLHDGVLIKVSNARIEKTLVLAAENGVIIPSYSASIATDQARRGRISEQTEESYYLRDDHSNGVVVKMGHPQKYIFRLYEFIRLVTSGAIHRSMMKKDIITCIHKSAVVDKDVRRGFSIQSLERDKRLNASITNWIDTGELPDGV